MAITTPSITEDLIYPAYQNRLWLKTIIKPGVVGVEDLRVVESSGTQVAAKAGNVYIEQTKALQEGELSFYNGIYGVPVSTETIPSNTVSIPTTHPQIAQIIMRVYDREELKSSTLSFAKLEWLNGTENVGATKAHIEEGLASSNGAAALPQSSYRLAYVLVPNGATKSSEFEIFDQRGPVNGRSFAHSYIIPEETREGSTYGPMATKDEATVLIPPFGLLFVNIHLWAKRSKETTTGVLYKVNGNEIYNAEGTAAFTGPSIGGAAGVWSVVYTTGTVEESIESFEPTGATDVTTGQLAATSSPVYFAVGKSVVANVLIVTKAFEGTMTTKLRRLYVESRAY